MVHNDLKQTIRSYSRRNLEERKNWYSPAAEAYNQTRPIYPQDLITQVINLAQLSCNSKILEVGCGPATATTSFVQLGSPMVCLEPNTDFFHLAQQKCQPYPHVELLNTSFEEWMLEVDSFDAVLAATSFHWIPPEIGYPKAAKALRENGYLILLWNKELQPSYQVNKSLYPVYEVHAPSLCDRYENRETQERILQGLGQIVVDSGLFKNLRSGQIESQVTYGADEYVTLLNTYSPYLQLDRSNREALFEKLRDKIERDFDGSLRLSYVSAFHLAQKS